MSTDKYNHTEHSIESAIYSDADVWKFYSIDEAEKHDNQDKAWKKIVEDFKEIFGSIWVDTCDVLHYLNGVPIYREYRVIGLEDNNAYGDYYWILEDETGEHRMYKLANDADFYKGLKTKIDKEK